MSNKEITLIEGDLKLIASSEPSIYGNGDMDISGNLVVTGTISSTGTSLIDSVSNIGSGVGIFKQISGMDVELKSVNAGSSKVTITDDTGNDEVDVDIVENNIVHQNLSGAGTNTHGQIDTHIGSTSNPHTVTIDQITPTTTKGDLLIDNGSNVIRFPVGNNDEVLTADSGETAGVKWVSGQSMAGDLGKCAVIYDKKSIGTQGGTFTTGAWRTRDLNTIDTNAGSRITLSSNQITLTAGKYYIDASAPANEVLSHTIRLRNITDSSTDVFGTTEECGNDGEFFVTRSFLKGYLDINANKTYEIQHQGSRTETTDGFGGAAGFQDEVYTVVKIVIYE